MSNPDDTDPSRTLGDDEAPIKPRPGSTLTVDGYPAPDPPPPQLDPLRTTSSESDRPAPAGDREASNPLRTTASESERPDSPGEKTDTGRVLAGRYRLIAQLGEGAHGKVWAADDVIVKAPVAVKWLSRARRGALPRIRREIASLRMLRLPGVVRLLDDGVEEDRPFLVMECVAGKPFPGAVAPLPGTPRRWSWASIAGPTMALLEILGRVHACGVVHRDLKPDNILVSDEGRPTVLDFGISLWSAPGSERLTATDQIIGTPAYLAPEQVSSRPVDERADLYAVGVMLYEALTGRLPHEGASVEEIIIARLTRQPPPARSLCLDLPPEVARVVDRLLGNHPADRFGSAMEVLAALRGEAHEPWRTAAFPRLGGDGAVEAVIAAVSAGERVDVIGPRGSGRSRCLGEAASALEAGGVRIAKVASARAPFESLAPLVFAWGDDDDHVTLRLAEVTARVEAELRAVLAKGVVLFIDDAEHVDPWSRAVIHRCGDEARAVVRALASPEARAERGAPVKVVTLAPLGEADLRPLFAGPDRLFHLREDAARLLWERTEGLPVRLVEEISLWIRLSLCRWDGPCLVIDRPALNALGAGLPEIAPARVATGRFAHEPHLAELFGWLTLGGHHLELPQLAEAMGEPVWRLEAEIEALIEAGVVRRVTALRVAPREHAHLAWSSARRVDAHGAIAAALQQGQPGRLFHLLKAGELRGAAREAVSAARTSVERGDLGTAAAALVEGLRAARQFEEGAQAEEEALLTESVKVALTEGTPRAMDAALYELELSRVRGLPVEDLAMLVRAAIAAPGAGGGWALEAANAIPPFADMELERRRQSVRMKAVAGRSLLDLLEGVIEAVAAWAEATDAPLARLSLAEGRALLRYAQGRFEEAAELRVEVAERETSLAGRISATLNASSALLEAFRHREAAAHAEAALELAARCRHPYLEAVASWLLRSARYRMGEAGAPDLELAAAVAQVGVPSLEGRVCFVEAAQALHVGEVAVAQELSGRAVRIGRELARPPFMLISRCLEIACGAQAQPNEVARLSEQALRCDVTGIGIQALGLLGRAHPEARSLWQDSIPKLLEGIAREHWSLRMDVLSVDEALAAALGDRDGPPPFDG